MVRESSSGVEQSLRQQVAGEAPKWGYLRLTSFSKNAAEETKHAIQSLGVGARSEKAPDSGLRAVHALCNSEQTCVVACQSPHTSWVHNRCPLTLPPGN